MRKWLVVALAVCAWLAPISDLPARDLTFEERVDAQEAIERVHYAHQIGVSAPFETAVPRALLEKKVRTYLEKSAALRTYWSTPITAAALTRELERMARDTRLPERLAELRAALGDDPHLLLECLARPALAERLTRNFFAYDRTIHATERRTAEALRQRLLTGALAVTGEHPLRTVVRYAKAGSLERSRAAMTSVAKPPDEYSRIRALAPAGVAAIGTVTEERDAFVIRVLLDESSGSFSLATYAVPKITWDAWRALQELEPDAAAAVDAFVAPGAAPIPSVACEPGGSWSGGSLAVAPEPRSDHVAVWTGSEMIVWGGAGFASFNTGGRYDPATDTWRDLPTFNAPPTGGDGHTAVWTGTEMIVWGADLTGSTPVLGGRYNPATDTWATVSATNAPEARSHHSAVWTGSRMIVWGGYRAAAGADPIVFGSGGRYDPATDTWSPTTMTDAPEPRLGHTAVWTGGQMIVWGGTDTSTYFDSGRWYDPATDSWSVISSAAAPVGRAEHVAIWTGAEMIVWGGIPGFASDPLESGARYHLLSNTWLPTAAPPVPERRNRPTAVWTGTEMIVWGGYGGVSGSDALGSGMRYDPARDGWAPTSTGNAPAGRFGHTAIWTGSLMIVWGGGTGPDEFNSGGRYDPGTDTWSPTYITGGPAGRGLHTAVWTGSLMIVWGGDALGDTVGSGGRYDPATDTWAATSLTGAPVTRVAHTAVWTGNEMIVWGGATNGTTVTFDSGGRYDPIADTWLPTSTTGAPAGRAEHTAVWTGTRMIVWGGSAGVPYFDTGGRYDPATDAWTATATTGAPAGRIDHTAIWTGSEMVVWGGADGSSSLVSGGRYDPVGDSWTPVSTTNAPQGFGPHTAVWTGAAMITWGGGPYGAPNAGGRYDPAGDAWSPTSLVNAPEGRTAHTAVWTGNQMIVWGGTAGTHLDSGGRYDPAVDRWTPVTVSAAPAARVAHTAIWTGDAMIVWGGRGAASEHLASGGRYALGSEGDPPVAEAGAEVVAECAGTNGTLVQLQGDATGCGAITFTWTGPFPEGGGTIQGSAAQVTLPTGSSTVTLRVDDLYGRNATDTVTVSVVDTQAPGVECPGNAAAECPGQPVLGGAVAIDVCDPSPAVTSDAPAAYPFGTTTVTYTATDSSGNSATCTAQAAMVDTRPPLLTLPADITVYATMPTGAVVVYSASAVDACSGAVGVVCTPASGSTFRSNPPGLFTTVTCQAGDTLGNSASGSFRVHVSGTGEQLEILGALVRGMDFHRALASALLGKVDAARAAMARGATRLVCPEMDGFARIVRKATLKRARMTTQQADTLLAVVEEIRAVRGCDG